MPLADQRPLVSNAQVRPARLSDLPRILELIEAARGLMRERGNTIQWSDGYPSEALIRQDLQEGIGYCLEIEGQAEAYFTLFPKERPEPSYQKIEGAWLDDEPYSTMHRLASTGAYRGIARACFDWVKSVTDNIRADTHRINTVMQHLFDQNDFKRVGLVWIEDGTERIAYHWRRKDQQDVNDQVQDLGN